MTTSVAPLSREEVFKFHNEGFLGPFNLCTNSEMADIRQIIDQEVLPTPGPAPGRNIHARHLDSRAVYDLVSRVSIVDRLKCILGSDIVIWSSNFWNKESGSREIPWHQDVHSWPIEPWVNITCWIAIDEVRADNSCVQIIPGSHRSIAKMVPPASDNPWSSDVVDPKVIDESKIINMELSQGQFFIFNERMLHHSNANTSERRRLGLAARYTVPFVNVLNQDGPPLFKGHQCILMAGEDKMGFNRMAMPPE